MLPIQLIRQDKERVLEGLQKKHFKDTFLVDDILKIDEERRQVQKQNDDLSASINAASKTIGQLMAQGDKAAADAQKAQVSSIKESLKTLGAQLQALEEKQAALLVQLPNLPHSTVPYGKLAEDNEVVLSTEPIALLTSNPLPHWELLQQYDLADFELGTKITGSGFPVYKGKGAKLQRALINYFLDYNTNAGYHEVLPPLMVNESSAYATGQLPDKEGQMYYVTEDNLYLIPTAEVPVTNIYRDDIIPAQSLPIKLTAYTPCFRREAGSYGKDVRGLNRLHQFDKVEIVQMVAPEQSYEVLEQMRDHIEGLVKSLGLQYRILRLCGGDMSFTSALTYDFEVYSAAQNRWLEVSSVSNFENFQANRLKTRYKDADGKTKLVHTLNGSSMALPRIVAALLEQYQTDDGIVLPDVLHSYFGATKISKP
jgi:seryl-tRNA synthetase